MAITYELVYTGGRICNKCQNVTVTGKATAKVVLDQGTERFFHLICLKSHLKTLKSRGDRSWGPSDSNVKLSGTKADNDKLKSIIMNYKKKEVLKLEAIKLEKAPSSLAKCVDCWQTIPKGTLRIKKNKGYYHFNCELVKFDEFKGDISTAMRALALPDTEVKIILDAVKQLNSKKND